MKKILVTFLLLTSCSARSIDPEFSAEYDRTPLQSFGYGVGSLAAGAAAPLICGTTFFVYPFRNLQGQGAIGVYFLPFTTLFGVLTGTARLFPMVGLGIADVATFGYADLSAEYFYTYNGTTQWCSCLYAKCRRPEEKSLASPK